MTLSHGVEVEGELQGGVLAGLARSLLTSESFFTTKVSAAAGGPPKILKNAKQRGLNFA